MTVRVRPTAGLVALVAATLVTTGCGSPSVPGQASPTGVSTSTSTSASAVIDSVQPCTLLTPQELQQFGQPSPGTPHDAAGETGCEFGGQPFGMTLSKANDGLDYFTKHADKFVKVTKNPVNGRAGVQLLISTDGSECSQVMAVGTGYVVVGVVYNFGHTGDPCAKALEIAQVIEPRLPK